MSQRRGELNPPSFPQKVIESWKGRTDFLEIEAIRSFKTVADAVSLCPLPLLLDVPFPEFHVGGGWGLRVPQVGKHLEESTKGL